MTHSQLPLRAALVLAAGLAPLTFASGQTGVVWEDTYAPIGATYRTHLGVVGHPDGGAIALLGKNGSNGATYPRQIEVRRLDENGDRLWSWERTFSPAPVPPRVVDLEVNDLGEVVLLVQNQGDCAVTVLDPDGTLRWRSTVQTVVTGIPFGGSGVGFSPAGDVYVTGVQDDFTIPPFAGRASILQLDGASGQETWRVDRVAINNVMTTFAAGDAFFAYVSPLGWQVERFDSSGARVYLSPGLQPSFNNRWFPAFLTADDAGRVAVGIKEGYVVGGPEIGMLDASGGVLWKQMHVTPDSVVDGVITSSGDLVLLSYGTTRLLWRYDSSGTLLWDHTAPPSFRGYAGLAATPTDGVVVGSDRTWPGSGFGIGALETVDALGNTVRVETYPTVPGSAGSAGRVAIDQRGNAIVGISFHGATNSNLRASTVKIVGDGDPSSPYCAPTTANSTGALSRLRAAGSGVASVDNLTLVADQLPPGAALFALNSRATGFAANPGGSQGNLCLAGSIGRYVGTRQIRRATSEGLASLQLELTETPTPTGFRSIVAGETWSFQVWHRDANPGATSNFTNGITVMFQ